MSSEALLAYLAVRGTAPGPLFVFQNGIPLSRLNLVRAVRAALESQGINVHCFDGHSFRIGAATTATACGIEESLIQVLGRWKSSAFTRYIQTPRCFLISVSSVLLSSSRPYRRHFVLVLGLIFKLYCITPSLSNYHAPQIHI